MPDWSYAVPETMKALQDLTNLVHFQQVSMESVKPKTSHCKVRVIFYIENIGGISEVFHQIFLSQVRAQLVKVR